MKIANAITLGRLLLVVVGLTLLALHPGRMRMTLDMDWVMFACLFVAAVTDFVAGWAARKFHEVSQVGRLLDPLVDKILVCGALVLFMDMPDLAPWVPGWVVVVMLSREFIVQSIRGAAEAQGHDFGADRFGKWKMVTQCVYVLGLASYQAGWDWPIEVVRYALWVALGFTVLSGFNYMRKAVRVIEF
ncbi:MAG TPA: CDP-diacylglycerol--glycerol-3-phosphate 3-phosphatidyltransferase [Planctomycetota bacterium]|nr:CDP-diacylglycerol--glycerol-3-phosphate 3-phosphatidyltransferase [Planctomycetota bacterium]